MMIESVPQTQEISFVLYLQILFCSELLIHTLES